MLLSEFSQAEICNNCEEKNLLSDTLNSEDIVDYQEDCGFKGSFFKIAPIVIYYYTKKKFLNMQLERLRTQGYIENNNKQYDE